MEVLAALRTKSNLHHELEQITINKPKRVITLYQKEIVPYLSYKGELVTKRLPAGQKPQSISLLGF